MLNFIKQTTVRAGKKILESKPSILREKGGTGNWVTEADLVSEKIIISSIQTAYPSHKILSEESATQLNNPEKVENLWIVDPLDGTTNAKFSLPFFSVSIAFMQNGLLKLGAVYDPSRNELFWAEKGKGAYLNDNKIQILKTTAFKNTIVDIGSPYFEKNFKITYPTGELFYKAGARLVNLGSAALECGYVACGRLSFYFETGLKPWDIAAGKLIVEEAGGQMESLQPYFSLFNLTETLTGNTALIKAAKRLLNKVDE